MKKEFEPDFDAEIIDKAKSFLKINIRALQSMENIFDENFKRILQILASVQGKIVVTAIGKSSYIARKMAATLTSTGSKAIFIHPSEASHGDLGIIERKDIVVAISNSGASHELTDIANYSKNLGLTLILLTRRKRSFLASKADFIINLQEIEEISPVKAPTTSTSMMLVLGDIIAICLSEYKSFSQDHYRSIHPGGQIGKDLMRVQDIMHTGEELPIIDMNLTIDLALIVITSKKFGCGIVVDDNMVLQGIITDGDLRRHMNERILQKKAKDIMTISPSLIDKSQLVKEALKKMNLLSKTSLLIVNEEFQPEGIIHIHDCLRNGGIVESDI